MCSLLLALRLLPIPTRWQNAAMPHRIRHWLLLRHHRLNANAARGAFLARHSASILPIPHFEIHLRSLSVPRPLGLLINCFHLLALLRLAIFLKAHRMGNDSAVHAQSTSKPSSGLPSDSLRLCSNSRTIGSRLGLRSSGVNRYLRLFSAALRVLPTCSEFSLGVTSRVRSLAQ